MKISVPPNRGWFGINPSLLERFDRRRTQRPKSAELLEETATVTSWGLVALSIMAVIAVLLLAWLGWQWF